MSTAAQHSLNNFYISVKFSHPVVANLMVDNIETVSLNALGADKSVGQEAAESLRRQAFDYDLPPLLCMVLDNTLTELGYS